MREKLQQVRQWMASQKLDAFWQPRGDEYLNEYVPPHNERLHWLSNFSGSAGAAVILQNHAALFTDGRYLLQAGKECAPLFEVRDSTKETPGDFAKLHDCKNIGYDPRLHSVKAIENLQKSLHGTNIELVAITQNPVDLLWHDRPLPMHRPGFVHDAAFAGVSADDKIKSIAAQLQTNNADALLVTDPTAVAWLLNVRGFDIPHMPVLLSTAILYANGRVDWYVDAAKISDGIRQFFDGGNVKIMNSSFAWDNALQGKNILIDPDITPTNYIALLQAAGLTIVHGADPVQLAKACKNETEIAGMRAAHGRDAVAVKQCLQWLNDNDDWDELGVVEKLRSLRSQQNLFLDESFSTIAGVGANGAVIHYRADEATNKSRQDGTLLLLDSGAHYLDGTTDITRTIALGTPTSEQRRNYTLVLKGHIALMTANFPEGTTGAQLDSLARQFLWQAGLDYTHGTGHGVGFCLSVHEGPQTISKRGNVALLPGMVVSIEPGYYKEKEYGIRLENLAVVEIATNLGSEQNKFYCFSCLTKVPFDERLIDRDSLTPGEKSWLESYQTETQ